MYASAGRINLIGEHTDYNGGYVFPGAIDCGIMAKIKVNGTKKVKAFSLDYDEYVEFGRSCGLGPDISCYSLCPWTLGKTIDEEALERQWGEKLDRFVAHVKAKGWFYNTLMERIRSELDSGTFTQFRNEYVNRLDARI